MVGGRETALAEAEVEYDEIESPAIYVKFPVIEFGASGADPDEVNAATKDLSGAAIVIWTTTPWTIPGNRAISFSPNIEYGLYEVIDAPSDNWAKIGDKVVLADKLAANVFQREARVTQFNRMRSVALGTVERGLADFVCAHPLRNAGLDGYDFDVPLLAGEHVTEDTGTGFVHTAPGHGTEDFEIWEQNRPLLDAGHFDTEISLTVDAAGYFTEDAPGFEGKRVVDDKASSATPTRR